MALSASKKPYKFCMVPYCKNTTQSVPIKIFITVPNDPELRKKWLEAANRNSKDISSTAVIYCCGDHFDLPNDIINWEEYQNVPNTKKILKPYVIPHRFECQTSRGIKRKKDNEELNNIKKENVEVVENIEQGIKVYKLDKVVINLDDDDTTTSEPELIVPNDLDDLKIFNNSEQEQIIVPNVEEEIKIYKLDKCVIYLDDDSSQEQVASTSTENQVISFNRFKTNVKLIKENSCFYIGIPEKYIFIIDLLCGQLNVSEEEVLLCLKKIRRNLNILPLANDFGMLKTTATQCLTEVIPKLARCLRRFIFWPKSDKILENLPRPFRKKYRHVESIIDCLEIMIPEPENDFVKSQYWSVKEQKYLLRHLISCTPDGFVSFVSGSVDGSKSDSYLLEISGYLDVMPERCDIMINKGFFDASKVLRKKRCQLYWPPHMKEFASDMLFAKYVEETKQSVIVKTYTDQVIKRFQEFLIAHPSTSMNYKMVPLINDIVVIIAGLINLQNSLYHRELYTRK